MSYWIFQANPKYYRLQDRLRDPNPTTTWKVSRYASEMTRGDKALIWQAGSQCGICAIMELNELPRIQPEIPNELPYIIGETDGEVCRVLGCFVHRFNLIPEAAIKAEQGLSNLSILCLPRQGTNFRVKTEEAAILIRLVEGAKPILTK